MNNIALSIVIPTYNERENIKILIPEIEKMFRDIRYEIIVVDDNSPDGTGKCVCELNRIYKNITLLTRMKKEGIGAALCEGYNLAKGEVILSSDADLSFSVVDMVKLFNCINNGYDLVIGCRHSIRDSYYEMRKLRTIIKGFISKLGNVILRTLSGVKIHDFSANFRAIRRQAWEQINVRERTNIILLEMILKVKHLGMKVAEVPVSFRDRVYGESKLNLFIEIPKYVFKMMYYLIRYR